MTVFPALCRQTSWCTAHSEIPEQPFSSLRPSWGLRATTFGKHISISHSRIENQRTVWVGRDPYMPCGPTPCNEQGHLQLHQVLRAPSSLTLGGPRDGIHHLSGQPVPVPHHPYCQLYFLLSSLNFLYLSLKICTKA